MTEEHRIDVTCVPPGALERMAHSDARPSPELAAAIERARERHGVDPEEVLDDRVEEWHNHPEDGVPLHEFLSMSEADYARWVECRMPPEEVAAWARRQPVIGIERALAELLEAYADLRSEYIKNAPPLDSAALEVEIAAYRSAARLVGRHREEDAGMGLPSWRWHEWAVKEREISERLDEIAKPIERSGNV